MYTWGRGALGLLGHGDLRDEAVPRLVESLRKARVQKVACGVYHTMVLAAGGAFPVIPHRDSDHLRFAASDSSVYTWGWGNDGRLGHGDESYLLVPRLVEGLQQRSVCDIACGYYHSMARSDTALIFTWGAGAHGRLGHGHVNDVSTPLSVKALEGTPVQQIGCGGYHSVVLAANGGLWTWGHGANGRLGHGAGSEDRLVPRQVASSRVRDGLEQIACGEHHTGVRMADGTVLTWGRGAFGRLGHGDEVDVDTPRQVWPEHLGCAAFVAPQHTLVLQVEALAGIRALEIACGVHHTLVSTEQGLFMWGTETVGRAPQATDLLPALVRGSLNWDVRQIASGGFHVAALVGASAPQHRQSKPREEEELSPNQSGAIAKMLKTVTSAETRQKLRDALARHGASVSPSLSRSVTSANALSASSASTNSPDTGQLSQASKDSVTLRPNAALDEALELARTQYNRRQERTQRSASEMPSRAVGSQRAAQISAYGDSVDKVIQRARRTGAHSPVSASASPEGGTESSNGSLHQLKQANASLRQELHDEWDQDHLAGRRDTPVADEPGSARSASSRHPANGSMAHASEIQELEDVVLNLEKGVKEQHSMLATKQQALDTEVALVHVNDTQLGRCSSDAQYTCSYITRTFPF